MRSLPAGSTIGPYVVDGEVGRGAMGAVYRARRAESRAPLALKVLHAGLRATDEQLARFRREAELAAGLTHPGIVRVHAAGASGALQWIAMDLVEGAPLSDLVGRLAPREAARLVAQVARAVEHAHARGVLHRDLKPGNILVRREDGRALVTDFGLARHVESAALTRTGALVGTPTYLAPEQAAGLPATPASDVHALGAVLHEALTGAAVFQREDLASLLVAIASQAPAPPGASVVDVPRALDDVCLRALAKEPGRRPTAGELAAALEAIAEGRRPAGGRGRVAAGLAGLLALAAVVRVVVGGTASSGDAPVVVPPAAVASAQGVAPASASRPPVALDPGVLSGLKGRDDAASLLALHDALDALEAAAPPERLEPRSRDELLRLLADLDRRWTEAADPAWEAAAPGHARTDRPADRLILIHWAWQRLDPGHTLPKARDDAFRRGFVLGAASQLAVGQRLLDPTVGRAIAALFPDDLTGHLLFAKGAPELRRFAGAERIIADGLAIAERTGDAGGWGQVARLKAIWLVRAATFDPARREEARREVLALADGVRARGLPDDWRAEVLVHAAAVARTPAEGLAWLAVARDELKYDMAPLYVARARLLVEAARGAGVERLGSAAGDAEAVRKVALDIRDWPLLAEAAAVAADVLVVSGQKGLAHESYGRALAVAPPADAPQVGLALRRALLLTERPFEPADLREALDDLARRLEHRRRRPERRPGERRIQAALDEVSRLLSGRAPADEVARTLSPYATAEGLELLDAWSP